MCKNWKDAAGEFFDWISDSRTPNYLALLWFTFLIGAIGAICAVAVAPNVSPAIALVAIVSGGALAVSHRNYIKTKKGNE